ncbi:MAG: sugar transferase [Brevundimonas sp.]|uniref:sugar transferase n=1 Tax=Brevundimonas sp. TaxID=1871086 RepID=UPI0017ECA5F1|nr:sugar transferase [Brevundimonas sp.]MBA4804674.1 sugar transferase [Brevundimonas sp.]
MQQVLSRVYGDATALAESGSDARTRLTLTIASLGVAFIVMPLVYALLVYRSRFPIAFEPTSGTLLYWNAAANALVMVWALHLKGRFDRKLTGVLNRVLLAHGALAFVVLVTRAPHSNQIMLLAAVGSAILGSIVMTLRHRAMRPRAALLGDWHPLADNVRVPCEWVQNPRADLSCYDVLLTSSVIDLSPEWAKALSRAMLMGKPVRHLAEFVEEDQGRVCLEHFDLEHLPTNGLVSYKTRKRLMDVGLVLLSLPLTLPLLLVGAIALKATTKGPLLFVQDRVGLGGRVFRMYKLRTMRPTPVGGAPRATTGRDDDRITPVGRWLRRSRIDELPQLWNVLKGDMSVIGPRPEWTLLSEQYVRDMPVYAYRQLVRPGITGWAQVRGGYAADITETRMKVAYDLFYIKNLSFSLDVQILGRTIWTLVSGDGAR